MNIWLDDLRPPLVGFVPVSTAAECIELLQSCGASRVHRLSLDHDLGMCDECGGFKLDEQALPKSCPHNGTGYDVVCWMERENFWPDIKPTVHSANPVGRERMQRVIDRAYRER